MGQLALKDGTRFQDSILSESVSDKSILLTIPKEDIVKCATTFGNPEKTDEISYTSGFFITMYTGYTELRSLTEDQNTDRTLIRLGAGEHYKEEHDVKYAVPEEYVPESLRLPKKDEPEEEPTDQSKE